MKYMDYPMCLIIMGKEELRKSTHKTKQTEKKW